MCDPPSKWPRSLKQLRIAWQCRVWCFTGWKVRTRQDGSFQCQSYGSLHRKLKPQLFVDLRMKASPSNFTECYRNSWSLEGVFLSFFWGGVVSARNHPAGGTTLSSVGGSSLKGAEGADQKNAAALQTSLTFAAMKLGAWGSHLLESLD